MKKTLYCIFVFSIILFSSCEKESFENEQLNIDYNNTLNEIKKGKPKPNCVIDYTFSGIAGIDNFSQNSFLFTWDFSQALIACNIQLSIEFRSNSSLECVGYPGSITSSHLQNFPSVSINSSGIAQVYYNPIPSLQDKVFEYRTVITGRACNNSTTCITYGDWQGPLCSYMW